MNTLTEKAVQGSGSVRPQPRPAPVRRLLVAGSAMLMVLALVAAVVGARSGTARGDEPQAAAGQATTPDVAQVPREIAADRTATTKTFALPGGLTEKRIYEEPVNYQDSEGEWIPIREGFRSDGGELEDRDHPFEIHLPTRLGEEPVRFGGADHWISFELEGPESVPAELEGDGAVAYEGRGADPNFEYSTLPDGLKETMELTGPSSPSTVRYLLDTSQGLTPDLEGDGSIVFRSEGGGVVATIPAPTVAEAGSSVEAAGIASYSLSPREGGWTLSLEVDRSWLEAPGRSWPVTVDPTLEAGAHPGMDCEMDSRYPSTSYCTGQTFSAGAEYYKPGGGGHGSNAQTFVSRSLLNFNWEELDLPAKVEIKEASVNLYAPAAATNVTALEMKQVTTGWNESTVTWGCARREGATCSAWTKAGGDFSAAGTELLTSEREGGSAAGWWTFTKGLAPVFQSWAEGATRAGVIVKLKEETATESVNRSVVWDSSRATNSALRPYVKVLYQPAAPASDGVALPTEGTRTPRFLRLRAKWGTEGHLNNYEFEYKVGKTGTYEPIPPKFVHKADGEALKEWPVNVTEAEVKNGESLETLYFDTAGASSTLRKEGGPIYIRVLFDGTGGAEGFSEPVEAVVDRVTGSAHDATAGVGPGTLDLQTGNLSISRTDVSIPTFDSGLEFARTYNTRAPKPVTETERKEPASVLGEGWKTSIPLEEAGESEWRNLQVHEESGSEKEEVAEYCEEGEEEGGPNCEKEYVEVPYRFAWAVINGPEGAALEFEEFSPGVWTVPPEISGWVLTQEEEGKKFKLKDPAGDVTTFSNEPGGGEEYVPISISEAGSATQATMLWKFNESTHQKKLAELMAPGVPGYSCLASESEPSEGCKALRFDYESISGVEGERLASVEYLARGFGGPWKVAEYQYNAAGKLVAEWDPRITPNLVERYTYGTNGELKTLTPPGQEPWTLQYATVEEEVGVGRLKTVERASLLSSPTMAKTTIAYDVPLSGSGAPYQMSASEFGKWGQKDPPTEATAVFPPSEVPSSPPTSWAQAAVYYMDSEGFPVDTATPKGGGTSEPSISVAEPEEAYGNIVRELTPDERLAVLRAPEAQRPEESRLLSTERRYEKEGTQLAEEWGPLHLVRVVEAGGAEKRVEARLHSVIQYEDPASEGTTSITPEPHLPTRETVDALIPKSGEPREGVEEEERTTETKYKWTLRKPTETIVDPGSGEGHLHITSTTVYEEATGLPIESRQPSDPEGGTAGATKTTYYESKGKEILERCWSTKYAGLPCKVEPAAQPKESSLPKLLVTKYLGYNGFDEPTEVMESPEGGTENVRKTITTYDAAGRQLTTKTEGGGMAMPRSETLYNPTTGMAERQQFACGSECATYSSSFGTSGSGELKRPMGIAVDASGDLYVVDKELNCVKKYEPSGTYLGVIGKCGTGGSGKGEFKEPRSIAIDPAGHIWVADDGNARVEEFSSSGTYIQTLGGSGEAGGNHLSVPYGVAVDGEGRVWVADAGKIVEFKETTPGVYPYVATLTSIEGSSSLQAGEMTVDSAGDLWIVENAEDRVSELERTPSGFVGHHVFGTAGSGAGQLKEPLDIKIMPSGNLLIVDRGNDRLEEFSKSGVYQGTIGSAGTGAGQFTEPTAVALGSGGAIYVTDSGDHRAQKGRTGSGARATSTTYNALGQVTSYEDADGNKTTMTYDLDGRPSTVTDAKGSQTYHYNETSGLLTSLEDSAAGTFTATYDADGNLVERGLPDGLTAKATYNSVDEPTSLAYTKTTSCGKSCTWYEESLERSIEGQVRTDNGTLVDDRYSYDKDGRLTEAQETPTGEACTTRAYTYDQDSNRLSRTARKSPIGEGCLTSGESPQEYRYDEADRLIATGLTYDAWGRITSLPAEFAGGHELKTTYYSSNMVASQSQNGVTNSYELDATGRQRQRIQAGGVAGTEIFHYDGSGDSPSWTSLGSTWSRNIIGIGGELAAVQESSGSLTFKLTDLHGDVVASASSSPIATELLATYRFDEFGEPEGTGSAGRFGWLGGHSRRTELSSGVIQMGARSYIPQLGRFLTPDPVRGGSANPYDYADQDPVNNFDLGGERPCIHVGTGHEACGSKASELRRAARQFNRTGRITLKLKSSNAARQFANSLKLNTAFHGLNTAAIKAREVDAAEIYDIQKKAEAVSQEEAIFGPRPGKSEYQPNACDYVGFGLAFTSLFTDGAPEIIAQGVKYGAAAVGAGAFTGCG